MKGTQQPAAIRWSAQRLFRPYVRWALAIALTLGFSTGAIILLLPALGLPAGMTWITHTQAHGAAQLFGWAGLFVMGVAFHVIPRFRGTVPQYPWPQRLTLALVVAGIALRFAGQAAWTFASPALLVASGVLLLAGAGVFVWTIGRVLRSGAPSLGNPEPWLWAGLTWLVVSAALHLTVVVEMARTSAVVAPPVLDAAFVHAAALGFVGNFILGVSARALPPFMALPPSHKGLRLAAFVSVNLGIAWLAAVTLLQTEAAWRVPGAAMEWLGFVLFVAAIRLFEPRQGDRQYIAGTYGRYEWFVRAAYGWLLVAGGLATWQAVGAVWDAVSVPALVAAPVLHVVALGFITMMIMGMAARMLPMFEGSELPHHWALDVAFGALNASVVLRVVFGLIPSAFSWDGLAVSGVLGLLALVLFAWVAWMTLLPRARQSYEATVRVLVRERISQAAVRGARVPEGEPAGPSRGHDS